MVAVCDLLVVMLVSLRHTKELLRGSWGLNSLRLVGVPCYFFTFELQLQAPLWFLPDKRTGLKLLIHIWCLLQNPTAAKENWAHSQRLIAKHVHFPYILITFLSHYLLRVVVKRSWKFIKIDCKKLKSTLSFFLSSLRPIYAPSRPILTLNSHHTRPEIAQDTLSRFSCHPCYTPQGHCCQRVSF